jgi:hypothetical protein
VSDELDLGDAAAYILAEARGVDEDQVWGVLMELGDPPAPGTEDLARTLLASTRPDIPGRTVTRILREWRAYASLASEPDWEDD